MNASWPSNSTVARPTRPNVKVPRDTGHAALVKQFIEQLKAGYTHRGQGAGDRTLSFSLCQLPA